MAWRTVPFDGAQHQGPDAEGIARTDQLGVGERHQRIAALDLAKRIHEAVDHPGFARAGHQMQDYLAVGGGLKDRPLGHELVTQGQEVGEVAVVADGDPAALEVGEHGLHVADRVAAGGGIAGVADGGIAGKALHQIVLPEGLAHVAEVAFGGEALAVEGGHPAGLLPAMLQGVQAQRHDGRSLLHVPDAKDAALQPGAVVVRIALGVSAAL